MSRSSFALGGIRARQAGAPIGPSEMRIGRPPRGCVAWATMHIDGTHHITCITADARANVDFYTRVLGLRLVKKTVNFDAPDVYHLYYGDERGTPGSILTFFEFRDAARGRAGAGMIHRLRWRV